MDKIHSMAECAEAAVGHGKQFFSLIFYFVIAYNLQYAVFYITQYLQSLKLKAPCPCQGIVDKLLLNQVCYAEICLAYFFQRLQKPEKIVHRKGYYRPCVKNYCFHENKPRANFTLAFTSMPAECSLRLVFPRYFISSHWETPINCEALADRKSTRLNSSHSSISYAVFC